MVFRRARPDAFAAGHLTHGRGFGPFDRALNLGTVAILAQGTRWAVAILHQHGDLGSIPTGNLQRHAKWNGKIFAELMTNHSDHALCSQHKTFKTSGEVAKSRSPGLRSLPC